MNQWFNIDRGDLGENAVRLYEAAHEHCHPNFPCVDVGVRHGVSSRIFLMATHGKVLGIDTDAGAVSPDLLAHPRYEFSHSDSVTALFRMTRTISAAMVDTLHIKEQVMAETYYLWPLLRVGGFIAYHDTAWPEGRKDHYLGQDWDRPEDGIKEMFGDLPGCVVNHFPESWGMSFVYKPSDCKLPSSIDWPQVFNCRNRLLATLPDQIRNQAIEITL